MSPRLRIMLIFLLHAVLFGSFGGRLAEVQRDLGLSASAFGLALAGQPVGFILGTFVSARINDALGNRRSMLLVFLISAPMPVLVAQAAGFWPVFSALFLFGLIPSFANVAINVEADRVAHATGKPVLARSHGVWGLGFLAASGLSVLAIRAGVTPIQQFWAVAALVIVAALVLIWPLVESPARGHDRAGAAPRVALPDRASLRMMGFASFGIVSEIIARSWAVIYLRDAFHTADWIAAAALPAFIAMQTMGRLVTDPLVARLGEVGLGRALAVTGFAGLGLLITAPNVELALVGTALTGLGSSAIYPLAIAALARRTERPSAESMAGFSILQNLAFLAAPVLFGFAAEAMDLRLAMALFLPLPVIGYFYARVLRI